MKRILITLWLVFVAMLLSTTYALEASETQQQTASTTWIEVGTVLGRYDNKPNWNATGPKELKLYVMYLGEKLIYRVEWELLSGCL